MLHNKMMALQFINAYTKYIQSQSYVDIKYDGDAQNILFTSLQLQSQLYKTQIKISVILALYKVGCVYELVQYTMIFSIHSFDSLNAPYSRINGWD